MLSTWRAARGALWGLVDEEAKVEAVVEFIG